MGRPPVGPGLHTMYDAAAVTLLAMQAAPSLEGPAIRDALRAVGVRYAFTVPGESFLGLLEGLVPERVAGDHLAAHPVISTVVAEESSSTVTSPTGSVIGASFTPRLRQVIADTAMPW